MFDSASFPPRQFGVASMPTHVFSKGKETKNHANSHFRTVLVWKLSVLMSESNVYRSWGEAFCVIRVLLG